MRSKYSMFLAGSLSCNIKIFMTKSHLKLVSVILPSYPGGLYISKKLIQFRNSDLNLLTAYIITV